MKRLYVIQFLACSFVFLTWGAAELAAYLLDLFPGSEALWYVNLVIFRPIQQVAYLNSPLHYLISPVTGLAAMALLAVTTLFLLRGRRLAIACTSHLCLLMTVGVGRGWQAIHGAGAATASLDPRYGVELDVFAQADVIVIALVLASVVATIAGHLSFLVQFGHDAKRRVRRFSATSPA